MLYRRGEDRLDFAEIIALNNIISLQNLDTALIERFITEQKKNIAKAKIQCKIHNSAENNELAHALELLFIEKGDLPRDLLTPFLECVLQEKVRLSSRSASKTNDFIRKLDNEDNILIDIIPELENEISKGQLTNLTGETELKHWVYSFSERTLVEKGKGKYKDCERITTYKNGEIHQQTKIK